MPSGTEDVPARILYLRPLTARREIVLVDDDDKEITALSSLDELRPACREVARAALAERYAMPQITQVHKLEIHFATQYWQVSTDRGEREFALKEPGKHITWLTPDHIILRDTMGCRIEIPNLTTLDGPSRAKIQAML